MARLAVVRNDVRCACSVRVTRSRVDSSVRLVNREEALEVFEQLEAALLELRKLGTHGKMR